MTIGYIRQKLAGPTVKIPACVQTRNQSGSFIRGRWRISEIQSEGDSFQLLAQAMRANGVPACTITAPRPRLVMASGSYPTINGVHIPPLTANQLPQSCHRSPDAGCLSYLWACCGPCAKHRLSPSCAIHVDGPKWHNSSAWPWRFVRASI